MNSKTIVTEAINKAKAMGITIRRGAVFDWSDNADKPIACNGLGAVLIVNNKEHFAKNGFDPNWLKEISKIVGEGAPWIWRFTHGFDYGNNLSFTYSKDGKDITEFDKISAWANKLANDITKE